MFKNPGRRRARSWRPPCLALAGPGRAVFAMTRSLAPEDRQAQTRPLSMFFCGCNLAGGAGWPRLAASDCRGGCFLGAIFAGCLPCHSTRRKNLCMGGGGGGADFRPSPEGETMRRGSVAWHRPFQTYQGRKQSAGSSSWMARPDSRPDRRRFSQAASGCEPGTRLKHSRPASTPPVSAPPLSRPCIFSPGGFPSSSRFRHPRGCPFSPLLTPPSARQAQPCLLPGAP